MRAVSLRILLVLALAASVGACREQDPVGPLLPDTPLETTSPAG